MVEADAAQKGAYAEVHRDTLARDSGHSQRVGSRSSMQQSLSGGTDTTPEMPRCLVRSGDVDGTYVICQLDSSKSEHVYYNCRKTAHLTIAHYPYH